MFIESSFDLNFVDYSLNGETFVTVFGILECLLLCMDTKNCPSFFYSHNKRSCTPSPIIYQNTTGLTPQAGVNYYSMRCVYGKQCSSPADCTYENSACMQGACQCAVGYSHQPSNCSCVTRCRQYGNDFAAYPERGISGCNLKIPQTKSLAACWQTCRNETEFTCITAEYSESDGRCFLCDKAWLEIPEADREYDNHDWDVYQRHCAA